MMNGVQAILPISMHLVSSSSHAVTTVVLLNLSLSTTILNDMYVGYNYTLQYTTV